MCETQISIVTPFKNTESFISECLRSIVNQTHTNWELVIVDDGSDDNSFKIVSEFAAKDKRIKLYENPGSGIIDALQFAFLKSSGNYITRMDSDDIMTPNRLKVMISSLKEYGKGHLTVGQVKYFRKDGISDGYAKYEIWLNNLTAKGSNYSEIYKECVIPSPCWMVHRDDFIACDGFNPNTYPEDYDLAFRFYKYNIKCIPCNETLHLWRDYSTRTSRTHQNYAENHFLELKVNYFLELDYNASKPLVLWGAGKKGKTVARLLQTQNIPFYWICDNPKKIGKDIYDNTLQATNYLETLRNPHCIITVANKKEQKNIKKYLSDLALKSAVDYFFYC
ncbi:glycosyltransferase family 2 protein [Bizionia argentinensis JUB59]|uniref:Glycosyltransferase family 2 protein n=1 Tax=Bizionia argentinensis JUB59 TaxID=1046627 RepID=G2E9Q3_9FLAO|nr:glycosyltransferase family 2 protein [Bizionia argentinensis]EGV44904.2 glycosyltransferase family 2 protein [Bizionia argentinensis JUB59]